MENLVSDELTGGGVGLGGEFGLLAGGVDTPSAGLVVKVVWCRGRRLVGGEMGQPSPSDRLALILDELEWLRI